MTNIAINEQIMAIKSATDKAIKSQETAIKFLTDAGIISSNGKEKQSANTTSSQGGVINNNS